MASGKSLELKSVPKPTTIAVHEQRAHTTERYKGLGGVANRKTRRAYAKSRGSKAVPAATLLPYEKTF